jgi:nitrogen fixation/metabolism regulation signal transduction histidine kinase
MGFSRRFATRLAWRTALLFAATVLTATLAAWGRAPTATLLAGLGVAAALAALWSLVDQGNADLARFVAALDRGDLTQSFQRPARGSHFDRLGDAYERSLARLRHERAAGAVSTRFVEALADGAPVALLVLDPENRVTLANQAARRLFGRSGEVPLASLASFGAGFVADLAAVTPGTSRLSRLVGGGMPQRVSLDATLMEAEGTRRRIVAVRIVQPELDRAELAAQVDLVRVLTHEIMNSLTPVVSLAATADRLMAALHPTLAPGVADAQLAAAALARRAAELERFVESYKGFSEAPALRRAPIATAAWLDDVLRLFRATPLAAAIPIEAAVALGTPAIDGDVALLTQILLNLLKNAAEAVTENGGDAAIRVVATGVGGGRVRLSVIDSGPGIPPSLRTDVFLPFFTTKRQGTGIGLSLARQIVLLHDGQIGIGGGSPNRIEIILPAAG